MFTRCGEYVDLASLGVLLPLHDNVNACRCMSTEHRRLKGCPTIKGDVDHLDFKGSSNHDAEEMRQAPRCRRPEVSLLWIRFEPRGVLLQVLGWCADWNSQCETKITDFSYRRKVSFGFVIELAKYQWGQHGNDNRRDHDCVAIGRSSLE